MQVEQMMKLKIIFFFKKKKDLYIEREIQKYSNVVSNKIISHTQRDFVSNFFFPFY